MRRERIIPAACRLVLGAVLAVALLLLPPPMAHATSALDDGHAAPAHAHHDAHGIASLAAADLAPGDASGQDADGGACCGGSCVPVTLCAPDASGSARVMGERHAVLKGRALIAADTTGPLRPPRA